MQYRFRLKQWVLTTLFVFILHAYIGVHIDLLHLRLVSAQNIIPLELIQLQASSKDSATHTLPVPVPALKASKPNVKKSVSQPEPVFEPENKVEPIISTVDNEMNKVVPAEPVPPIGQKSTIGRSFLPLPSAKFQYATTMNGVPNSSGVIDWLCDGQQYRLEVKIPLPFIGPFVYNSEGHIDSYGLAPDRYTEQRGKKATWATNFNRDDRSSISFSRLTTTLPLVDGAQDRFSVLMQLVGLVRGQPEQYAPANAYDFYIADSDSGETWRLVVQGTETIETSLGMFEALHVLRLPRYPEDKRQLEVWLAPALGWAVAQWRQTEPNGLVAELKIESITPN